MKRKLATDDFTYNIIFKMFNNVDSKKSKLKWMNQKCMIEDVCISMSHILHKNMKNSEEERIFISTYYTAILKNNVNLKIQECEIKNKMSAAM